MHKPPLHVLMLEDSSLSKIASYRYSCGSANRLRSCHGSWCAGQTYEQVIVKRLAAFGEMPALLIL